jgi:indole-3-acetate monooxygenase
METQNIDVAGSATVAGEMHEIARQLGPKLESFTGQERSSRRLSREVVDLLKTEGFYKLFTPLTLGGAEMDPVSAARIVEEVARYNTAAGWSMMVANTSAWWCSRLSENGIDEIFGKGPDIIMAGAFHPPMRATEVKGGYRITGQSPLTSNVHEADWIFVTAFVMDGDQMKMNAGIPEVIGVCMDPKHCRIIDTWHTVGMCATDSNDVAASDVFVPHHLSFHLSPEFKPNSFYSGKLYRFPAIGASVASLISPIPLAIARNAIREVIDLAGRKVPFGSFTPLCEKGTMQRKLGIALASLNSSEAYLYHELRSAWMQVSNGDDLTLQQKAAMLLAVTHTNQSCLQAIDLMYSAGGSSSVYVRNKLALYFADAQVIRQHGFVNESRYETAAQIYLGLPPDLAVVAF